MLVGVEQADRHRLDLLLSQSGGHCGDLGLVNRAIGRTVRQHSLADLVAEAPLHDRWGLAPERVVEVRHPHPAELQDIPEPLRGDQRQMGAPPFQDGVGGHRGSVDDLLDRPQ